MTTWQLLFVGTGGFHSAHWKCNPCMILSTPGARFMFDCGDGSFGALHRLGEFSDMDLVLLTGGTAEEIAGLTLLGDRVASARQSTRKVAVVCPPDVGPRLDALAALKRGAAVPLQWRELDDGDLAFENSTLEVRAFRLKRDERDPGLGYVVQERLLRGRVNMDAATRLGLKGRDIGRLVEGKTVQGVEPSRVVGPPRPGRKVVIAGRTRPCAQLLGAIADADLAVMAAAYIDERFDIAISSQVLTGWEAAEAANEARVKTLALYNTSSSNADRVLRAESSQYHDGVLTPQDGDRINVFLNEARRAPEYVRASKSRRPTPVVTRPDRGGSRRRTKRSPSPRLPD